MFYLTSDHRQQMLQQATAAYPEECCGILIGLSNPPGGGRSLLMVWPCNNTWDAIAAEEFACLEAPSETELPRVVERSRRYWIDPREMLAAQRYARTLDHPQGTPDIIGIYHSHPDAPAIPSECDRRWAWANYSYIIISVHHGTPQELLCWRLDDHHQFQPEPLVSSSPSASTH